MSADYLVSREV